MRNLVIALAALTGAVSAQAAPLMSAEWAKEACAYWNSDGPLTTDLFEKWNAHDKDHSGYKVIHMYRSDCGGPAKKVELTISIKDGKTMCSYGGAVQHSTLRNVDYQMGATTKRWMEWGKGQPNDIGMFDMAKLDFDKGSMTEAMQTMQPFKDFMVIAGRVAGTTAECK
jgi:putative sterol carrier protein